MVWGKMFHRFMSDSNKSQATPLGRVETVRMTVDEYHRMQAARYRRKNVVVCLLLLAGVLSVYGYSMYAVKQDPLKLDELVLEDKNSNTSKSSRT